MKKNNITIYGIKTNNTYHYIGKTGKNINEDGTKNKSKVTCQYKNNEVKNILNNDDNVVVVPLEIVNNKNWYDKKLIKVVEKHKEGNPLLNASWMLNGNKGYWQGLKRDQNSC
jgi:acyl-CoA hydrolase